MNIESGATVNY